MLTVWRTLHVELDSMEAVHGNTVAGTVQDVFFDNLGPEGALRALVEVSSVPGNWKEHDHFNMGGIWTANTGHFQIFDFKALDATDLVILMPSPVNASDMEGWPYVMWDDDMHSYPIQPWVALPRLPDTGLLEDTFKRVYIQPQVYTIPPVSDQDSQFLVNTGIGNINNNKDLSSEATFWAVHVTSAFQPDSDEDGDPEDEALNPGLTFGITQLDLLFLSYAGGSFIFLETIREAGGMQSEKMTAIERQVVVHEIGHQFLLRHSCGYADPPGPEGDFLMSDDIDENAYLPLPPNTIFSPESSHRIRAISHPQL